MVLRIGHRGAKGYAPENTLLAFKKAIGLGIDMIEVDVRKCKSGELIAFHDPTLGRMTDGRGRISQKTLEQLKKSKIIGEGQEKIPTLREVLDLVNRKTCICIDIKSRGVAGLLAKLIKEYLTRGWRPENFLACSRIVGELKNFKKLCPNIRIGLLFSAFPFGKIRLAKKINAYSLHPIRFFSSEKIIERAHEEGLKVFSWTINNPEKIEKMKKMGVDGIISNFPDRV